MIQININVEAIFSDETKQYVTPNFPTSDEIITIRIRTGKNDIDEVSVHYFGKDISETLVLNKFLTKYSFDYYEISILPIKNKIKYYFILKIKNKIYYYNKEGFVKNLHDSDNFHFNIIPDFSIPNWAVGAISYEVYVDRFFNGDLSNDVVTNEYFYNNNKVKEASSWNSSISETDSSNFYGGDLKGIIDKMYYFNSLGVEVIYLSPIFISPSSNKYDVQDFENIDPHYGIIIDNELKVLNDEDENNNYANKYKKISRSHKNLDASNELFKKLVETAHKNGIKVILDGSFNSCSTFNKWFNSEGIYISKDKEESAYSNKHSHFHNYFLWDSETWSNNKNYVKYNENPKLNYENSSELCEYIFDIASKWVSPPYNADGWRLSMPTELGQNKFFNHEFWSKFRTAVKSSNSEAIIIGECYENPTDWLQGDQWDTLLNYNAFMKPLAAFITGMDTKSYDFDKYLINDTNVFIDSLNQEKINIPIQSLSCSINQISNYTSSRFLTRTNKITGTLSNGNVDFSYEKTNKNQLMLAVILQMTWLGSPSIYYGDEVGLTGWANPGSLRTFPWGNEDIFLLNFYKTVIKVRKKFNVFKTGSTINLYSEDGIFAYGRFDIKEKIVIILNNNSYSTEIDVPVWRIAIAPQSTVKRILEVSNSRFSLEGESYTVVNNFLKIKLEPMSGVILKEN